jgi:hypothetical protein
MSKENDVGIWHLINPPVIVPLSKRAREVMKMPEGTNGVIFPYDPPEAVLGLFPKDFVFKNLEMDDFAPLIVSIGNLQTFH